MRNLQQNCLLHKKNHYNRRTSSELLSIYEQHVSAKSVQYLSSKYRILFCYKVRIELYGNMYLAMKARRRFLQASPYDQRES